MKQRRVMPEAEETAGAPPLPNILIVDDDPAKLIALRAVLAPLGANLVEARSGADALRHLLKDDFAVILLDVRMPIMSGFETAEMIRQRPASEQTPIIFVTAFEQAETNLGRGYELGAVDFVFSPIVPAILRAKVTVFVELYKSQHELKRYRTQLQGLVQERTTALTAINRELEAFNYFVSHDLRAPLLAIDTIAQSLMDNPEVVSDATKDQIMRLRRTSKQMMALFDGMQTLFRLTGGDIRREKVDINRIATEIGAHCQAQEPKRRVDFRVEEGLTASGDAGLVRILLTNLISNAWKFTRDKPQPVITIGSERVAGENRLFVRDNGVGFDMIYAHKLFGAFQRLHSQSEFAGEGIGLAVAQRIVNRHGGRIWAEGAACPQGPARGQREVIAAALGHQHGPVRGIDDSIAGHAIAVEPVSRLQVDVVADCELRKVDPVHVVGRHAHGALVAGPWRVGIVARPAVEDAAADAFLHRGEVAELRDLDREVDAADRMLERRVDLGRRGCRDDHVLAPCLVDAVLVFDRDRGRVEEADDQDDPCGDEQQCCRPQRVQAASGLCCALSLGVA
ncbi:MAG: response regulator [Chloroflexi bacterium]|nr:MAG: response regulator [Chloroflexota bacterium]